MDWCKNQSGQAVAEAALVLPLLIFIFMGIFVVGRWLYVKQVVVAAAREGARVGAQTGDYGTLEETARAVLQSIAADEDRTRITVSAGTEPNASRGSALLVEVRYRLPPIFTYFKNEYEKNNPGQPFPFTEVVAQSVARLEIDFKP